MKASEESAVVVGSGVVLAVSSVAVICSSDRVEVRVRWFVFQRGRRCSLSAFLYGGIWRSQRWW